MIRIAGLNKNDVVNGEGISVSLFLQGCHFHCKGCHNPEAWDPKGGTEYDENELIDYIISALDENGIHRNLSILGGEPLDTSNKINFLDTLIWKVKTHNPNTKICIWTGYDYNWLKEIDDYNFILYNIDYLIDGPFEIENRDITLKWRGSRNQHIRNIKTGEIE